jgi:predicted ATPase
MIKQLQIRNFKSWSNTGQLQLAPLTGLFGANSSGKTSILQMLLMLKQTVESPDRKRVLNTGDDRSLVDLGTFFDLIHGHSRDASLDLLLSWNLPEHLQIEDPEQQDRILYDVDSLTFEAVIKEESGRAAVDRFCYSFSDERFGMSRKQATNAKEQYELILAKRRAIRFPGRPWPLPSPVKCYGFPDEVTGYFQNVGFLSSLVLQFEKLFARMAYLGPLREYPKRSYVWAGESPEDVGRKGELAIPALLASRAKQSLISLGKGKRRQTLEERIAYWLREMGMIHSFSLKAIAANRKDYELRVRKTPASPEVLITDVGFGVSQILPVLVLCYYVPEGSIVVLEQPEIHLHPSVQAWLADVFIEVVNRRNVQIILESHSEHLLRRLQRRIAEKSIPTDRTGLYFCRMDNATSTIEKLNVDLVGRITNWPEGFFGDEMGELAAMTEAVMKRQAEAGS